MPEEVPQEDPVSHSAPSPPPRLLLLVVGFFVRIGALFYVAGRAVWTFLDSRLGQAITIFCLAVLLLIRATLQDTWWGPSILFYASPYPGLLLVSLLLAVAWLLMRQRLAAFAAIILSGIFLTLWLGVSYFPLQPPRLPPNYTVQFWNMARAKDPEGLKENLVARGGNIIGAVEAGTRTITEEEWQALLPQHQVKALPGGMLIAVRGKILQSQYYCLESNRARINEVNLTMLSSAGTTVPLTALLVDIHSNPLLDKGAAFDLLLPLVRKHTGRNLIVMGDFNTPLESVHFQKLRDLGMQHAHETAGSGLAETWPGWIPLLSIDHVWISKEMQVNRSNYGRPNGSDHRPVIAGFRLKKAER